MICIICSLMAPQNAVEPAPFERSIAFEAAGNSYARLSDIWLLYRGVQCHNLAVDEAEEG